MARSQSSKKKFDEKLMIRSIQEEFVSNEIDKKAAKIKADLRSKIKIREKDGSGVTEAMFEGLMDNLFMKFRSEVSDGYGIDVRRGEAEEDPEVVIENIAKGKRYSKVDGNLISAVNEIDAKDIREPKVHPVDQAALVGKNKHTSILCRIVSRNKKHEMISARKEFLEHGGGHVFIK